MTEEDALFHLYNRELVALSSEVAAPKRLAAPDASVQAVSVICGSEVKLDLALDDAGRVAEIGYEVEACALTKAVMAVLVRAGRGRTREEISAAHEALRAMLEEKAPPPQGAFAGLAIVEPVADYRARHESVMLPFVALEKAFSKVPKKSG